MVLARCEFDATDEAGDLLTGVTVEVRRETGELSQVYSDRDGLDALGNPFVVADGKVGFHVAGGAYKITVTQGLYSRERRYVPIGLAAETDFTLAPPRGLWDSGVAYAEGDLVYTGGAVFISFVNANLNNAPDSATPGDTDFWMYAGTAATGPTGPTGLDGMDALTEALTEIVTTAGSHAVSDTVRAIILNLASPGSVDLAFGAVADRAGASLKISDWAGNVTLTGTPDGTEKLQGVAGSAVPIGISSGQGLGLALTLTLFPNTDLSGWFA